VSAPFGPDHPNYFLFNWKKIKEYIYMFERNPLINFIQKFEIMDWTSLCLQIDMVKAFILDSINSVNLLINNTHP
jgi:hypothetical protein